MVIRNWLLDIRDYAYYLEKKQNGELLGEVRYQDKLFFIFFIYYSILIGAIIYFVRAFYYIQWITVLDRSSWIIKLLTGLILFYMPFKVTHYFLKKHFDNIPFPDENTPVEEIQKKKRVFWGSLLAGIILLALEAYGFTFIGYVGNGPIF